MKRWFVDIIESVRIDMTVIRKISTIVIFCIIIGVTYVGITYMSGWYIKPQLQLTIKEFQWDNQPIHVILRFESDDGVFTTGKTIHVQGLLYYPTKINPNESFSLYFPNTLTPEDYNKLINNTQWKMYAGGSILVIPGEILMHNQEYFTGNPATSITTFDKIWTKEGLQDGYVIIEDSSNPKNSGNVTLDKVINIQPSDVLQNLQTTNALTGLTYVIIALTIIVGATQFIELKIRFFNNSHK